MMVAVFAAMTIAFGSTRFGPRRLAALAVAVSLVLAAVVFAGDIHSPRDGFRMPWLQGAVAPPRVGRAA